MARIRTIKPEFWESETIACLSIPARLTFIACLNAADDEGLLRWNAAHIKSFAFPYDDDVLTEQVSKWLREIEVAGLVFSYREAPKKGSKPATYGWIVNFHEHQRINRPSPSKYPPPSLQNTDVRRIYGERANWTCQLTGKPIQAPCARYRGDTESLSLDHIIPRSKGGTDYPSNIRATTQSANKSRGNKDDEVSGSLNDSVSDSVSDSCPEGKGKGEEREREREREREVEEEARFDARSRSNGSASPKQKPKQGTRLPEDWIPSEAEMAYAVERLGEDRAAREIEDFRDYWLPKTGKDATKLDWGRTWKRWVRKAPEFGPGPRGSPASPADKAKEREMIERYLNNGDH